MPAIPVLQAPLSDGTVSLRDTAERDIPEILIAHEDDPQLYRRIGLRHPPSGAELGSAAERERGERSAGFRARLTVTAPDRDQCSGEVVALKLDWEQARGELELWIAPDRRRRGWGTRALMLASRWLIDSCGLMRVGLLVQPDNEPMLGAATRAGFAREGRLRAYLAGPDGREDVESMSLLAGDLERRCPTGA